MSNYDPKYMWNIPDEDTGENGVLLSDRIELYIQKAHLIEPADFTPEGLRPASYDLRVGDHYYVNDERKELPPKGRLEIPRNGLAFVVTRERFNIPYYMVGRYSLRVTQVYRGLMIDNGLHIDPGYHGQIYIPVHNFTDESRVLYRDDPFLSIEFTRTTHLPQAAKTVSSEADLIALAASGRVSGAGGFNLRLFAQDPSKLGESRAPEDFWKRFPSEKHVSSLQGISSRLKKVQSMVSRRTLYNFALWLGSMIALLTFIWPWFSNRYYDTERAVKPLQEDIVALKEEVRQLRAAQATRSTNSGPAQQGPSERKQ